ncbi:MAG TPA: hypothetical protein VF941_04175 [Clostridia bacterium]
MADNAKTLHYKQFINEKSLNDNISFKELCNYIVLNIDSNSKYLGLLDEIYKTIRDTKLIYISSTDNSMQLHFEKINDGSEKDIIFEGVVHFGMRNIDFDYITKINISYGYSVSIFHSMKNNKILFGTMLWDKFDEAMPKCTIVAEKLILKSKY